ncbi:MAG: hypothetical protein FWC73_14040 [Defluviitaleaceae bacterium]|nr:hypothetical protein [Defluviitaleaceae bacterium]
MKKKLFAMAITLVIVLSSVVPVFAGPRVVDSLLPCENSRQVCIVIPGPGIVATRGGPGGGNIPPPQWP